MTYQEVYRMVKRAYGEEQLAQPVQNPFREANRKARSYLDQSVHYDRNKARVLSPEYVEKYGPEGSKYLAEKIYGPLAEGFARDAFEVRRKARETLENQKQNAATIGQNQSWTQHFWPELKRVPGRYLDAIKAGYKEF